MSRINLTREQLKKLGVEVSVKKYTTPYERLQKAIKTMEMSKKDDEIFFDIENKSCALILKDIKLLSNNDLLRNDNRKINKFKKLWHQRIFSLVNKNYLEEWDLIKENKMILECLYKPNHGKFMDPDAISAAFKAPLDGLVESNLLIDDKIKHLPLIISKQEKNKEKRDDLVLVLSVADEIEKYYTNFFKKIIKANR